MRLAPVLVCLLAVAGPAAAATPRAARLTDEVLTITLSDGTTCRLKNWQARPQGRFDACAPGLGYDIRLEPRTNPFRALLEGIEEVVDGAFLLPMADIRLTDAAGREYRFTSPPPETMRD